MKKRRILVVCLSAVLLSACNGEGDGFQTFETLSRETEVSEPLDGTESTEATEETTDPGTVTTVLPGTLDEYTKNY